MTNEKDAAATPLEPIVRPRSSDGVDINLIRKSEESGDSRHFSPQDLIDAETNGDTHKLKEIEDYLRSLSETLQESQNCDLIGIR